MPLDGNFFDKYIGDSSESAHQNAAKRPETSKWLAETILGPAYNAAVAAPVNAIGSTINGVAQRKLCGRIAEMQVAECAMLSNTWWIENLASGLAMSIPYAIAGAAAGAGLRSVGARCGITGYAAKALQSEVTAQIVGAGVYDAMRETRSGETRLGNAMAGIAAFGIYSVGGMRAQGLSPSTRVLANIGIGAAGGAVQSLVSEGISQGRLANREVLLNATISGAAMNAVLPTVQHKLNEGMDRLALEIGQGLPIDRLLKRNASLSKAVETSHTLHDLVDNSPWVRVNPKGEVSSANGKRITLDSTRSHALQPQELGHELVHSQSQGTYINDPLINHARSLLPTDAEAAWNSFREARIAHEISARRVEHRIAIELGKESTAPNTEKIRAAIPGEEIAPGLTYEALWRQEFAAFAQSAGIALPTEDFKGGSRRRRSSFVPIRPTDWTTAELISHWSKVPREERAAQLQTVANGRRTATDSQRLELVVTALSYGRPNADIIAAAREIAPEPLRDLDNIASEVQVNDRSLNWGDIAAQRGSLTNRQWAAIYEQLPSAPPLVRALLTPHYTAHGFEPHPSLSAAERIHAWSAADNHGALQHLPPDLRLEGLRHLINTENSSPLTNVETNLANIPQSQRLQAISEYLTAPFTSGDWYRLVEPLYKIVPEANRSAVILETLAGRTPNAEMLGMEKSEASAWASAYERLAESQFVAMPVEAVGLLPDRLLMDAFDTTLQHQPADEVAHMASEINYRVNGRFNESMIRKMLAVSDPSARESLLGVLVTARGARFELFEQLPETSRTELARQVVQELFSLNHDRAAKLLRPVWETKATAAGHAKAIARDVLAELNPVQRHSVLFGDMPMSVQKELWQLRSETPALYEGFITRANKFGLDGIASGARALAGWQRYNRHLGGAIQAFDGAPLGPADCIALQEVLKFASPEQIAEYTSEVNLLIISSLASGKHLIGGSKAQAEYLSYLQDFQHFVPTVAELRALTPKPGSDMTRAVVSDLINLIPPEHRELAVKAAMGHSVWPHQVSNLDVHRWIETAKNLLTSESEQFIGIVFGDALSAEQQFAVIDAQARTGRTEFLKELAFEKPNMMLPIVRSIVSISEAGARARLLEAIGTQQIKNMSPRLAAETARTMFMQLAADRPDSPKLREWWSNNYGNDDWWTPYSHKNVQDMENVARYLVDNLPTETLVNVAFDRAGREYARQLAIADPELFRFVAEQTADPHFRGQLAFVKLALEPQRSKSLAAEVRDVIEHGDSNGSQGAARLLAFRAMRQGPQRARALMEELGKVLVSGSPYEVDSRIFVATEVAEAIHRLDPSIESELFFKAANQYLTSRDVDYNTKLTFARDLAAIFRAYRKSGFDFDMPSLRMPVDRSITPERQNAARAVIESALRDPKQIRSLFGEGLLGQLFPRVFGHGEGIVNRRQGGSHAFTLDEHIAHVVENVSKDPAFHQLSEKDQTDLLLAALFHDVGKRPGGLDPDHEWVGANIAHGALSSLGYEPQRVQRIANLISRHSDVSYAPARDTLKTLENSDLGFELLTHYRRPGDAERLRILNRSDIAAIDAEGSYLSAEVARQLDQIAATIEEKQRETNQNAIPLLTSSLPREFGLYSAPKNYVLLGHTSDYLRTGTFLRQRPVIESPEYSMSTSLMTPDHLQFYAGSDPGLVAIVTAPQEHVSKAYRANMSTGNGVGKAGHVRLTRHWTQDSRAQDFVKELNRKLAALTDKIAPTEAQSDSHPAVSGTKPEPIRTVDELWTKLAQFDTIDELVRVEGAQSPTYQAYRVVVDAMTHHADGTRKEQHNEVKVNNATVVGIGIVRGGKPVAFQNANRSLTAALLNGQPAPPWLVLDGTAPSNAVIVPEPTWREALADGLPFIALD